MPPAGKRLRARIERRADSLAEELRAALLLAYRVLFVMVPATEVERRIAAGLDAYTDAEIERALALVRVRLRNGVEKAGTDFTARPV